MQSKPKTEVDKPKDLRKVKIQPWTKRAYLNEIGQDTGIHFAFLSPKSDGYRQCHAWIKCRDYLCDALRTYTNGKKESIYGFSYVKDESPPLDMNRMRILVKRDGRFGGNSLRTIVDRAIVVLNCLEKHHGIKPLSKLYEVANSKDMYVFVGSGDWMESTFMISLYTLLIRLSAKKISAKDKKDLDDSLQELSKSRGYSHDIGYLITALPYIDRILENRKKLKYKIGKDKYLFDGQNISLFHSYTGVVAICNQAKSANPRTGNNTKLEDLIGLSDIISDRKKNAEVPKKMKEAGA